MEWLYCLVSLSSKSIHEAFRISSKDFQGGLAGEEEESFLVPDGEVEAAGLFEAVFDELDDVDASVSGDILQRIRFEFLQCVLT